MTGRATRFGRPLPPGGTIGVPAPATPYHNRSELLRDVEWWESTGHRVKLSNPYTQALISVVPKPDPRDRRRSEIPTGETPNPVEPPP